VDVLSQGLAPDPRDRPVPAELRLAVQELWEEHDVAADQRWGEDWGGAGDEDVTQVVPRPEPVTEVVPRREPVTQVVRRPEPVTEVVPRPEPLTEVVPAPRPVAPTRPMPQHAPHPPEPYWPEPYQPEPYQPDPYQRDAYQQDPYAHDPYAPHYPPPPTERPRRAGVLLCGLVAVCAVAAYLPVVVLIAAVAWGVLARTVNAAHGGVLRRRYV
jgi:hypothetical protein